MPATMTDIHNTHLNDVIKDAKNPGLAKTRAFRLFRASSAQLHNTRVAEQQMVYSQMLVHLHYAERRHLSNSRKCLWTCALGEPIADSSS